MPIMAVSCNHFLVGGFSPTHLKNMLVKLDHFPKPSGWKFQKYLSCHHPVFLWITIGIKKLRFTPGRSSPSSLPPTSDIWSESFVIREDQFQRIPAVVNDECKANVGEYLPPKKSLRCTIPEICGWNPYLLTSWNGSTGFTVLYIICHTGYSHHVIHHWPPPNYERKANQTHQSIKNLTKHITKHTNQQDD